LSDPAFEKYRDIRCQTRHSCVVCGQKCALPAIRLPDFPLTDLYVKKRSRKMLGFVDQEVQVCSRCGHGQLAHVIDAELQYGKSGMYSFRTSQSACGREVADFFIDFFNRVVGKRKFGRIVEVGCNDLYVLKRICARARELIGIDPILKGRSLEASEGNIVAVGDFFENVRLDGLADVVICKDVLEHLPDPREFLRKAIGQARDKALFFIQVPLLDTILEGCRFDQVFHQHVNYFSLWSIQAFLKDLGCGLVDWTINNNHWGAGLFAFQKRTASSGSRFPARKISPEEVRERYKFFKGDLRQAGHRLSMQAGRKIYGYGATPMLPVLAYHFENGLKELACIVDDDKGKDGLSYLNMPVSIAHTGKIRDWKNAAVLLTAISSRSNVRKMLANLIGLGARQVILPLRTI
jgi:hypothetical protein